MTTRDLTSAHPRRDLTGRRQVPGDRPPAAPPHQEVRGGLLHRHHLAKQCGSEHALSALLDHRVAQVRSRSLGAVEDGARWETGGQLGWRGWVFEDPAVLC